MKEQTELIKKIHSSGYRFVTVSSGGGTDAISALLRVPGASKSVLEAYVPYAKESLDYYLLKKPDKYCSEDTTLSIAAKAFSAAKKIDPNEIHKNLRCLVCQGQSISDSNSDFAQTIKLVVTDLIIEGKTEKEIYSFKPEHIITIDSPGFNFQVAKFCQYARLSKKDIRKIFLNYKLMVFQ